MAIRAIIGFEHLPQGDASWATYADHGLTRGADLSAQNTIVNGWIVSNATGNGSERVSIPASEYIALPVEKIWFGVRMKIVAIGNAAAGILWINNTYVLLLNAVPGYTVGGEYYLEISYTPATGVVERRVNGTAIANQTIATGLRSITIGLEAKHTTSNRLNWRDIYICDDQEAGQGLPIGPLGQRTVAPIYATAVVADTWTTTPSETSLLAAVSSPGTVPTAAVATSADIPTSLSMTLHSEFGSQYNVDAIDLTVGVSSTTGSAATLATKLKQAGDEVAGKTVQAPLGSYNYSGQCGVFSKSPSGSAWTPLSINATDLVLTPNM